MQNAYQDPETSKKYINFLNSENGRIQQQVLLFAIKKRLPKNSSTIILDAGCATGWLAGQLQADYSNIYGCDNSEYLINIAKKKFPTVKFEPADLESALPYVNDFFDTILLNMVAPDVADLKKAFQNLSDKLKISGTLIITIPNPFYTSPVAEWKRTFWDFLLFRKPKLKIKQPYIGPRKIFREFGKGSLIPSHFHSLEHYFKAAHEAKLQLTDFEEIISPLDSLKFNLQYQLFRYPLLLLLEFEKAEA